MATLAQLQHFRTDAERTIFVPVERWPTAVLPDLGDSCHQCDTPRTRQEFVGARCFFHYRCESCPVIWCRNAREQAQLEAWRCPCCDTVRLHFEVVDGIWMCSHCAEATAAFKECVEDEA